MLRVMSATPIIADNPIRGITLKIISVLLFTGMATCIKAASHAVPPGEAVFFRSFFAIPVILIWLSATARSHRNRLCGADHHRHPRRHFSQRENPHLSPGRGPCRACRSSHHPFPTPWNQYGDHSHHRRSGRSRICLFACLRPHLYPQISYQREYSDNCFLFFVNRRSFRPLHTPVWLDRPAPERNLNPDRFRHFRRFGSNHFNQFLSLRACRRHRTVRLHLNDPRPHHRLFPVLRNPDAHSRLWGRHRHCRGHLHHPTRTQIGIKTRACPICHTKSGLKIPPLWAI